MNLLFVSGFLTGLAIGALMSKLCGEAPIGLIITTTVLAVIYCTIAAIS